MKTKITLISTLALVSASAFATTVSETAISGTNEYADALTYKTTDADGKTVASDFTFEEGTSVTATSITFASGTASSIALGAGTALTATNGSVNFGYNNGAMTSESSIVTAASGSVYVNTSAWNGNGDSVSATGLYFQGTNATYSLEKFTGTVSSQTQFSNAQTTTFSDSTLNLSGRLYVRSGANVVLKNSTTTLTASELSQVNGSSRGASSLTIDGGTFTVGKQTSAKTFAVSDGELVIKGGAKVDMRDAVLATRTGSGAFDAVITITGAGTEFSGKIGVYTYDSMSNTTRVNISDGAVANVSSFSEYSSRGTRGGTITVDNATLNLASDMIQGADNGTQVYTTNFDVVNGGTATVEGAVDVAAVKVDSAALSATEIVVGAGRTLELSGEAAEISAETLTLSTEASVTIGDPAAVTLNIQSLNVVAEDAESLAAGSTLDLTTIFGGNEAAAAAVLDAVSGTDGAVITVTDASGVARECVYSSGGTVTVVPEPSAFGLLAGVGALALVASRRRRNKR